MSGMTWRGDVAPSEVRSFWDGSWLRFYAQLSFHASLVTVTTRNRLYSFVSRLFPNSAIAFVHTVSPSRALWDFLKLFMGFVISILEHLI